MLLDYLKKSLFTVFLSIVAFTFFVPTKASAQIAVPVDIVPGTTLYFNTITTTNAVNATSWNTAVLAAKETGIGYYTPPGAITPIPITGAQAAASSQASADSIGIKLVKPLIQQFTNSLVTWINHGFQGGPQFVTDPASFFINVADRTAGSFIEGSDLSFLCAPFKNIRLVLNLNYSASFRDKIGCTLSDVVGNMENFTKDFNEGGWNGWFSMTQNRQNNVYGAYLTAEGELNSQLASSRGIEGIKLDWGQGFLSHQECLAYNQNRECVKYGQIETPGQTINRQLEEVLGTNLRQLELADEFDEIVGALVNQLMQQVVTKAGGLLGS